MRVYADLFFLFSAGADYGLLLAAARLAGARCRPWRLAAGAAVGGLYALAVLLLPAPVLGSLPATVLAASLMLAASFAPVPPRVFVRLLGCLYACAAFAAGLALALSRHGGFTPWWVAALGVGGALLAGAALYDRYRPGASARMLVDLEIGIGGRRACCRALVDTGNNLRDPCGAGPAVVVDALVLRSLLPPGVVAALSAGPAALAEVSAAAEPGLAAAPSRPAAAGAGEWVRRVRLLPYRAVGGGGGVLCGFRPDGLWLGRGSERRPVRAVLAVSPAPLDPGGAFAALVPGVLTEALAARWAAEAR